MIEMYKTKYKGFATQEGYISNQLKQDQKVFGSDDSLNTFEHHTKSWNTSEQLQNPSTSKTPHKHFQTFPSTLEQNLKRPQNTLEHLQSVNTFKTSLNTSKTLRYLQNTSKWFQTP